MDANVVLRKDDGISKPVDEKLYQSLVGSLLYAALATRPDIQHAVSIVAKYNSAPSQAHLTAAKRILRYLNSTKELSLCYEKDAENLTGFCDADYARDLDDRHSTSGYVFLLGKGAISWYSGKQKCVSTSTAQAEYIALNHAIKEALFLRQLRDEIGYNDEDPVTIMEDNRAALSIAKNPTFHSKAKHIDICYHFAREAVSGGKVNLCFCGTADMVADIFTKPLARERFAKFRLDLGLRRFAS